ncbi:MAG: amidase [Pseudomonadales bacterium]|nr:amidase [Pseudomonadales bacterium]
MDTSISVEELADVMRDLGMTADEAASYKGVVEGILSGAAASDAFDWPEAEPVKRNWVRPDEKDNPHGAWYVQTDIKGSNIKGSKSGKLAGMRVAVKDNLLLAGVPLMNGTSILEGYEPQEDAEIVTRMLAEGATIVGKTVCEAYCFSGGSHTSATGPVLNPHNPEHSAGGSSSGSGVVVATGEVDAAIGCDQGGSIRMPASFCGIVGMKPTWGLIPYTGILGMNPNIDHTGPMTATVAENARLLEVLAGRDGEDSRQIATPEDAVAYADELGASDLAGLKIGIVQEGFGLPSSQPMVDSAVRAAAESLTSLGAEVIDMSVPLHAQAGALTFGGTQAITTSMFNLDGNLLERPDLVPEAFIEKQNNWRARADELPANVKTALISSEVIRRREGFRFLARTERGTRLLRQAYDDALATVDLLVMPTTPMTASRLPAAGASPAEVTGLAFAPLANTSAFNRTHHPAMSVPCGLADGLPIGMMFVGQRFAEATIYRAGHLFEQQHDWRNR